MRCVKALLSLGYRAMHRNPVKRGPVLEPPVAVEQLPLVGAGRDSAVTLNDGTVIHVFCKGRVRPAPMPPTFAFGNYISSPAEGALLLLRKRGATRPHLYERLRLRCSVKPDVTDTAGRKLSGLQLRHPEPAGNAHRFANRTIWLRLRRAEPEDAVDTPERGEYELQL